MGTTGPQLEVDFTKLITDGAESNLPIKTINVKLIGEF